MGADRKDLEISLSDDTIRMLDGLRKYSGQSRTEVLRQAVRIAANTGTALDTKAFARLQAKYTENIDSTQSALIEEWLTWLRIKERPTGRLQSAPVPNPAFMPLQAVPLVMSSVLVPKAKTIEGQLIETTSRAWYEIIEALQKNWALAYTLPAEKLEEIVAGAFHKDGYDEVTLTKRSGDDGRDVIAIRNGAVGIKVIASVKRYAEHRLVKYDDVRALLGTMSGELDTSKGLIATTSDFPKKLHKARFIQPFFPTRLGLMNGTQLLDWLTKLARKP